MKFCLNSIKVFNKNFFDKFNPKIGFDLNICVKRCFGPLDRLIDEIRSSLIENETFILGVTLGLACDSNFSVNSR